jgi:stage III sporulation protein SpoIIIAA
MEAQPRIYASMLESHLSENRQMAILTGPRQVGKTTLCRQRDRYYFNWDNVNHRQHLLAGPEKIAEICGHALQVVLDLDYEAIDCFEYKHPIVVPAQTLLSQLV